MFAGFQPMSMPAPEPSPEEKRVMDAIKQEAENLMHMQGQMRQICFSKCVHRFREGDLDMGESSCDDRCVGKYLQAYYKLSQYMPQLQEKIAKEAPLTKPTDLFHY
ncbi:Aste57867_17956 [Aphanomyces stellatus]|uniref:Mitochondrial import inner membrane translocase subunit n=1 Tax=Aphanomyces stellatus TaxID=120398 RepID=A0A485LAK2_9STRA|nr:hypothetical protein As57867_017894 [Aphanomyces stellatus]VFT94696.1 Aste57867_17956 [Aphanomyces stellatus]